MKKYELLSLSLSLKSAGVGKSAVGKLLFLLVSFVALGFASSALAGNYSLGTTAPVVDGVVQASVMSGDYTYIGGSFTNIGTYTDRGVILNPTSGLVNFGTFPAVDGTIYASVSDGSGGWFIGGNFTSVGGTTRNSIAHILSGGTVDPNFNPNANGGVVSLALSGTDLYVGGAFTSIGGQTRNNIAKLNATNGTADATFNPNANGGVGSLALSGTNIYAGGSFRTIGGQPRNTVAKLDTTTGVADPTFVNGLSGSQSYLGSVSALLINGSNLYVGGGIYTGGLATGKGGQVDTTTGAAASGFPYVNGKIRAIKSDNSGGWYIGGDFTSVGGVARNYLAHILSDKTVDTSFDPSPNNTVYAITGTSTELYASGRFTTIGGQNRNYVAKLSATTGVADVTFTTGTNNLVTSLYLSTTTGLYLGGYFDTVGATTMSGIARVSTSTGAVIAGFLNQSLSNNGNNSVFSIVSDGGSLYLGGNWGNVGSHRTRVTKINATTGAAITAFNSSCNGEVYALALSGTDLYVGGNFTSIGGQTRNYIAKLNATNGTADATFNPNANSAVYSLAISGTDLYAGGWFSTLDGGSTAREYIAKVNTSTGVVDTSFTLGADNFVYSLALSGSNLYAGGDFTSIGASSLNAFAKLDTTTGVADLTFAPLPSASAVGSSLALSGNDLYVGGQFTSIGGQTRNKIAKLNATNGTADATFNPNADSEVYSFALSGTDLYVGGRFTNIGGLARNKIAKLSTTDGTADVTFNPNASANVKTLTLSGTELYVGGEFTSIGRTARNRIAKFNTLTGVIDTTFNPNAGSTVYSLALSGTDLYLGGFFTTLDGGSTVRNRLAKVNTTTGIVDTTFNPNANSSVNALALLGSNLYVGGVFTSIDGKLLSRLAKVDTTTGSADFGFNPSPNSNISSLAFSGSDLYVGGNFGTIGGFSRSSLAKLNATTGLADSSFNASGNSFVRAIVPSGTDVYVGGDFTTIGGQTRDRIAKLSATTGLADSVFNPNLAGGSYSINQESGVATISLLGNNIYVGGDFTTAGGGSAIYKNLLLLSIDYTAPTLSMTSPVDASSVKGTINLTATATDNVAVTGVTFYAGGEVLSDVTSGTSGTYTYAWNTTATTSGSKIIQAVARDAALNYSTSTVTITVDNDIPSAPTIDQTTGSVSATAYTISGTAEAGTTINISDNGSAIATVTATGGTYTKDITLASDTTNNLSVTATDTAGNISSATSISVTHRTTGGAVAVAYVSSGGGGGGYTAPVIVPVIPKTTTPPPTTPGGRTATTGGTTPTTTGVGQSSPDWVSDPVRNVSASSFTTPIVPKTTSPSVTFLQTFLAKYPDLYPEGIVTGYYGALTQKAVERFQTKYGIVSSGDPITTGYGKVGAKTLAKLNEIMATTTATTTTTPGGRTADERGGTTPTPTITTPTTPTITTTTITTTLATSATFPRNLRYGMTGDDVVALQKTLNTLGYTVSETGEGSAGNEGNYFGTKTQIALQKFQCKELQICSGLLNTTGYGFFGPMTRVKLTEAMKQ